MRRNLPCDNISFPTLRRLRRSFPWSTYGTSLFPPGARTRTSPYPLQHRSGAQLAGRRAEEAGDGPALACQPLPRCWGELPGPGLKGPQCFTLLCSGTKDLRELLVLLTPRWPGHPCPTVTSQSPARLPQIRCAELPRALWAAPALAQVPMCLRS